MPVFIIHIVILFIMQRFGRFHLPCLAYREPDTETDHAAHQQVGSPESDSETPPGIRQAYGIRQFEVKHIEDEDQQERDGEAEQYQSFQVHQPA